jgi:hypothetical protein
VVLRIWTRESPQAPQPLTLPRLAPFAGLLFLDDEAEALGISQRDWLLLVR